MEYMDAKFFKPFVDGTIATFSVTCGMSVTVEKPFIKGTQSQPDIAIAGVIGIVSQKFTGSLILCFPEKVFLGAMSKMLGEEFKEITNELQDGVAELMNQVYGQAKIVLNQQGYQIERAIPTVVRGDKIQTLMISKSKVMVLPFKTEIGEFYFEICAETSV